MNILITGVAGFIGSHAAEELLAEGHSIVGIDNFDAYYPLHFKLHNLKSLQQIKRFSFFEGDILDKGFLGDLFDQNCVDIVLHLAAKAGVRPSIEQIEQYYRTNLLGTLNLLECMRRGKVSKMVFASSSSVYGNDSQVPFSENALVDNPISPYASSKRSAELLCSTYCHLYGFDITCLRLFTVFGPRQRPDLAIHKFTRLIDEGWPVPFFGDGNTGRDYTYIGDITQGIGRALKKMDQFKIYNLGESRIVLLRELIGAIEARLGKRAILDHHPLPPGDVRVTYADISKARDELGYDPKIDLATGINHFVTWYLSSRSELYPSAIETSAPL